MPEFSAGSVLAMLALIEGTIITLFLGLMYFIWEHYARKSWVNRQIQKHTREKH